MVPTVRPRLGAIVASIFFAMALCTGCGVDLEREDGRLSVEVEGIDASADQLRLQVSVAATDATASLDLVPTDDEMSHTFGAVPTGLAEVSVTAFSAGRALQVGRGLVDVEADAQARLSLTLGPIGGEGEDLSATLVATIGPVRPSSGTLSASAEVDATTWASFVSLVQAKAGDESVSMQLGGARVTLDQQRSNDVETLQALWPDAFNLEILKAGASLEAASASFGEDTTFAQLTVLAADATAVTRLTAGPPTVRLTGTGRRNEGEDHQAYLDVEIELTARAQ